MFGKLIRGILSAISKPHSLVFNPTTGEWEAEQSRTDTCFKYVWQNVYWQNRWGLWCKKGRSYEVVVTEQKRYTPFAEYLEKAKNNTN